MEGTVKKFLGVGLTNGIALAVFTMFIIVMSKVIFTKHPVKGVSEFVQSV